MPATDRARFRARLGQEPRSASKWLHRR
jgi:hypothetical protein